MKNQGTFTIGEVAQRAGLRTSALRYYESAGLLPPPTRVSGQRRYEQTVFRRLAIIDLAQEAGFSLRDIRTLLRPAARGTKPTRRWTALALAKLPEVEALLLRAQKMKALLLEGIECSCASADACPAVADRVRRMADSTARRVDSAARRRTMPIRIARRRAQRTSNSALD